MLKKIAATAIATLAVTTSVSAQSNSLADSQIDSLVKNHKIIFLDGKPDENDEKDRIIDSLRSKITEFYYDQFRHFSDPDAPYFLFLSRDSQLAMGIGGAVRMRAYYDWDGAQPSPGFAPYLIPMTKDPANMRHFDTTPAGTCLFFRVIGRNKVLGNYQLYIEANFNGYQSRDFHLKKAYAIINDFTIGYANSTFSDPAAVPPTVDAQGPANKISPTATLIRYMPVIKDKWVLAVSGETPSNSLGVDGEHTKKVSNWMPDWAAFAQYQWQRGQHIRLSGIVRTLSYRDLVSERNHNIAGWGLQLSSVSHPADPLTLYLTASYGKGYAGTGGDLSIGSYDLVGNPDAIGKMYAPASYGWCLGLQYNFRPNLFVSANASQTRYLPQHTVSPSEYRYGMAAAVNVFWNLTPRIQVGAEYDYGVRHDFNGASRSANRVGAMCMFSF